MVNGLIGVIRDKNWSFVGFSWKKKLLSANRIVQTPPSDAPFVFDIYLLEVQQIHKHTCWGQPLSCLASLMCFLIVLDIAL